MGSDVVFLRHADQNEVEEASFSSCDTDFDCAFRYSFGNKHKMICQNDAVTSVKCNLLRLEEVIGIVKMNLLFPSLGRSLISFSIWVMSDENSTVR